MLGGVPTPERPRMWYARSLIANKSNKTLKMILNPKISTIC